ncbi:hypothetical protein [Moritella sp. 28]|uniref:hypothetical protein n=1 Tax=Moritella sp. 28 TaxID=2746232 RepID=UPI001BA8DDBB|nr:hypothetical protein [Moritella sp. 28]QUM84666.1 hypothetical protein HWV02_09205 [Moritella sp. 28]
MKNFLNLFFVLMTSCHVQANPLSSNLRQYILSSDLGQYHATLSAEDSDKLIQTQLQVATECLTDEGQCEHALYSLRTTAEIKANQLGSPLYQQMFLFLQDSYTQLAQGNGVFTPLRIPVAFAQQRIELMRQAIIKTTLARNGQTTPLNYPGSYPLLLQLYQANNPSILYVSEFDESLDLANPITQSYKTLLIALLKHHAEKGVGRTALLSLMGDIFKDIVNKQTGRQLCEQCTTTFIVEYYSSSTEQKWYKEVDALEYIAYQVPEIIELEHHRVAFPHYYTRNVAQFILYFKVFFHENESLFMVDLNNFSSLDKTEQDLILDDVAHQFKHRSVSPNFLRILHTTFRWLTATGQIESMLSSGAVLNGLASNQFNAGSHNKIFAVNIAANVILTKIPNIILGETQRYGCASDEWAPPQPFYMLLEDKCVYSPSFQTGKFSITASTTYGAQDQYDYEISIYHKPTNQTLMSRKVSNREEITLKYSTLAPFNLDQMVMYISSTNPATRGDIASIQLSPQIFEKQYGGVIKNNRFYFVQELPERKFYRPRGDELGCPMSPLNESQQQACLSEKFDLYNALPDYFYQNMTPIGYIAPLPAISIEQVLQQREAERLALEQQAIEDAMSGQGWGPGSCLSC